VEQGRSQTPGVGGGADRLADELAADLLGRQVGVGAKRAAALCGALDRAGDAEVDQPRRQAHDDVVRLDVEVEPAALRHVLQGAGDVGRQRQQLLQRDRAVATDQPPQRGTVEVLDQQVRPGPSSTRSKPRTSIGCASAPNASASRARSRSAFSSPTRSGRRTLATASA